VEIGGACLAIGDSLAFGHPVEPHDRCSADDTNFGVLVLKRQKFRFSIGGVGDECRLVFNPAIRVAVAELRRAERVECFGVGRKLSRTECLDALCDGIFIRRSREGQDNAQEPNGKSRQGQLTTIDVHRFLRFLLVRGQSCSHAAFCRAPAATGMTARTESGSRLEMAQS